MTIKVKTKKDIIDQFSYFDEKDGLYKLELKAKGIVAQETIEETQDTEELALVFNALLEHMKIMIENEIEEKRVIFKKEKKC